MPVTLRERKWNKNHFLQNLEKIHARKIALAQKLVFPQAANHLQRI